METRKAEYYVPLLFFEKAKDKQEFKILEHLPYIQSKWLIPTC